MLDILSQILEASATDISPSYLILCTAVSLLCGVGVALTYMYRNTYTKNFVVTLALLPSMVQLVIMIVNGNLGAGVAVMGAFSLVRFRSIPGTAKEISSIFFAMAIGLATGMGCLSIALLFLTVVGLMTLFFNTISFGEQKRAERDLRITIPENLEYNGLFDDLFADYTKKAELIKTRTTNMGSLYELTFRILLNNKEQEKEFIDKVRCRNGNLSIVCGRVSSQKEEL